MVAIYSSQKMRWAGELLLLYRFPRKGLKIIMSNKNNENNFEYEVLVVDDDKVVADSLNDALDIVGIYDVTVSNSASAAINLLHKQSFDAFLVDQRMPEMTGVEFIHQLINFVKSPLIYIITAEDDGVALEYAEKTVEDGGLPIKRYVPKPWPSSLFSVDLREDLRERDLVNDLARSAAEHSKRQKDVQIKLEKSYRKIGELEQKTETIINSVRDGVCSINLDGNVEFINLASEKILDIKKEKVIGLPIKNLFSNVTEQDKSSRKIVDLIDENIKNSGLNTIESKFKNKSGADFYSEISVSPLMHEGNHLGGVLVLRDITERKSLESEREKARLRDMHSSRLVSIGELASGIAHELNQPLQTFKYSLYNVKQNLKKDDFNIESLLSKIDKLDDLSDFMATVITNLRGYAQYKEKNEEIIVKELIESVLSIMGRKFERNSISVKYGSSTDLKIRTNKSLLMQVLVNLFSNSMDAHNELIDKKKRTITVSAESYADGTNIHVEDNAGGIPKEIADRIFEPFITTKSKEKGMGMGLYIVHQIVTELKGNVSVSKRKRTGAKFTISLPNLA